MITEYGVCRILTRPTASHLLLSMAGGVLTFLGATVHEVSFTSIQRPTYRGKMNLRVEKILITLRVLINILKFCHF